MSKEPGIFISYSREDGPFARSLADALTRDEFHVWFDEDKLESGQNWDQQLSDSLKASDFAIVILSPSFLSESWPQQELKALISSERENEGPRIIPVWHGVKAEDVRRFSPLIADRHAVTSDGGIVQLAEQIRRTVLRSHDRHKRCIVVIPQSDEYKTIRETIIDALDQVGIDSFEMNDQTWDVERFSRADFAVVYYSASDPNTSIELGMAIGLKIPVILIMASDSQERLPEFLNGYRSILYSPDEPEFFGENLRRGLRLYADR